MLPPLLLLLPFHVAPTASLRRRLHNVALVTPLLLPLQTFTFPCHQRFPLPPLLSRSVPGRRRSILLLPLFISESTVPPVHPIFGPWRRSFLSFLLLLLVLLPPSFSSRPSEKGGGGGGAPGREIRSNTGPTVFSPFFSSAVSGSHPLSQPYLLSYFSLSLCGGGGGGEGGRARGREAV